MKIFPCLFLAVIVFFTGFVPGSFDTTWAHESSTFLEDSEDNIEFNLEDESEEDDKDIDSEKDQEKENENEILEEERSMGFESPVLLLGEPSSGAILLEREIDKEVYPASITKIMTLLLAMESLERDMASLDDEVVISKNAEGVEGTTLFLEKGKKITLKDLLIGVAVGSANDASVAVAEHISGSVSGFVEKMNQRAKELGMENTNFTNPHGLHHEDHYTTARDIYTMSLELLKYQQVLEWFQIWLDENYLEGQIGEDGVYLSNTNRLINWYPGCDGLKTGFTDEAKHGISATAFRNGQRFVAIVLEGETSEKRFDEAAELLDFGFSSYETKNIFDRGEKVEEIEVNKGKVPNVGLVTADELAFVYERGEDPPLEPEIELEKDILQAPVEEGEVVGRVTVKYKDKIEKTDLVADEEVLEAGIRDYFGRMLETWVRFGT